MSARRGVAQRSHREASVLNEKDPDWREKANCAESDPEMFFNPLRYAEAQLVCMGCPVTEQCKDERRGAEGVWGGRVFEGKKRLESTRDYLTTHGTEAGYKRHKRAGEEPCPRCLAGAARDKSIRAKR